MPSLHSWALEIGAVVLCLAASNGVAQTKSEDVPPQIATSAVELPDSPGTTWARLQESPPPSSPAQAAGDPPSPGSSAQAQTQPANNQQPTEEQRMQHPVGTAAAEAPKVSGVTAAQPAGVAIAPAKQRRVRILVLKVGAILAASAAIGTVVALSAATPSKPPGAH